LRKILKNGILDGMSGENAYRYSLSEIGMGSIVSLFTIQIND